MVSGSVITLVNAVERGVAVHPVFDRRNDNLLSSADSIEGAGPLGNLRGDRGSQGASSTRDALLADGRNFKDLAIMAVVVDVQSGASVQQGAGLGDDDRNSLVTNPLGSIFKGFHGGDLVHPGQGLSLEEVRSHDVSAWQELLA